MFRDTLAVATRKLLKSVESMTTAMNEKKETILRAERSISEAQEALAEVKRTLSL